MGVKAKRGRGRIVALRPAPHCRIAPGVVACENVARGHRGTVMLARIVAGGVLLAFALTGPGLGQDKDKKKAKARPASLYKLGPDSLVQKDVPRGKVIKMPVL